MKLSLIDFKKHANEEFDLEGNVVISGRNGEGKTSILEGVVFTLFGRNFYGKVATDVFIRDDTLCATGILSVGGTEIKRTVGSENAVYLNGAKSKVAEVGGLFPTVEMAMPVINPLYFMYEMTDVDKRELFMKLLPQIDRIEVFKKHYKDRKDLVDRFKSSSLRGIREQINNSETILKANASQIATYELDIKGREDEIAQIRKEMPEAPRGVLEKEKKAQMGLEQAQRELGLLGNPNVRISEYEQELEDYKQKVAPIIEKLKVKTLTEAVDKLDSGITALEDALEKLRESLSRDKVTLEQLKEFESGKCPLCNQPVSGASERIEKVKEQVQEQNEQVIELKEKINKYTRIYESVLNIQENVTRCSNGIKIHSKKLAKYEKLLAKVKELEGQLIGNNKQDFKSAVERERMREAVKLIQNEIMRKKGTIARLKETNKKLENDLPDLKILQDALSNSGVDAWIAKDQAKEIEKLISKYIKLDVVTVLENKTNDNTREVFEVTKDGVSFRSMSFGERIKVSIAFGLVLRDLIKGFNLPFVLLDEGSVLSDNTLKEIKEWLKEQKVDLIYTKARNSKLSIKKDE
jgi:DNA repair protein SbcC/Rad50